jgi:hypothetical protein
VYKNQVQRRMLTHGRQKIKPVSVFLDDSNKHVDSVSTYQPGSSTFNGWRIMYRGPNSCIVLKNKNEN